MYHHNPASCTCSPHDSTSGPAPAPGPTSPDASLPTPPAQAGYTVADVARRLRVGEDKVRGWIARGELAAINTATALCGKPRWVIPPEALAAFERSRAGGP